MKVENIAHKIILYKIQLYSRKKKGINKYLILSRTIPSLKYHTFVIQHIERGREGGDLAGTNVSSHHNENDYS